MYMKMVNDYYEQINSKKTPEEIYEYVKNEPIASDRKKKTNIRWTYVYATVAAFAIMITVGIGACATDLLDFNSLFDNRLEISDEMLGNELLGMATDFQVTMPDKEYQVVMNGVTGSDNCVVFQFDIVRKDGKPVVDDFTRIPETDRLHCFSDCTADTGDGVDGFNFMTRHIYVNDEGNISIYLRVVRAYKLFDSFEEAKFTFTGGSFFTLDEYLAYQDKFDVPMDGVLADETEVGEPLLKMDKWSIEFVYTPSVKSRESIVRENINFEVPFMYEIVEPDYANDASTVVDEHYNTTIKITDIELSHVGGLITVEYDMSKHDLSGYSWMDSEYGNKIMLLMEDNTQVPIYAWKANTIFHDNDTRVENVWFVEYRTPDFDDVPEIIDLDKVKAISVNNYIYTF